MRYLPMRYLIVAAVMTMLGAAQSSAQAPAGGVPLPPDQIVAMRQSAMMLQAGTMAAMKAGVEQKADVKPFIDGAKALASSGKLIPAMFPAGTDKVSGTKAKPAIWSDPADFAKDGQALTEASTKLVALAEAGDKDGFAAQFKVVGQTCGACHRAYKERD